MIGNELLDNPQKPSVDPSIYANDMNNLHTIINEIWIKSKNHRNIPFLVGPASTFNGNAYPFMLSLKSGIIIRLYYTIMILYYYIINIYCFIFLIISEGERNVSVILLLIFIGVLKSFTYHQYPQCKPPQDGKFALDPLCLNSLDVDALEV
jgi:hypothetical protein